MKRSKTFLPCVTVLMSGVLSAEAQQPTVSASGGAAGTADLEEVVVTGTRQSNLTAEQSTSPITVLSADALEHSGKLSLQEVLSDVLPSLDLPSQAGGDFSSIIREVSLRGLNADQVLVLVNGKRWHPSAIVNVSGSLNVGGQPVDLNSIPSALIERVEVLSDGAAALYGSDAIAGVINIILKSDTGGKADIQAGQYYPGDGRGTQADVTNGFSWGPGGSINLSGTILRQNITNRALDATLTPLYYPGDPRNNRPDGILYKGYGIPDTQTDQFGINATRPLSDLVTFYAFGSFTRSIGENWEGFRAANNANNVTAIYPDGFEPRERVKQVDFDVTAGVKGTDLLGWNWDFSSTYGQNADAIELQESVNPTYGLQSPTDFREGDLIAPELTNNLDFQRSFDTGVLAAPLSAAFGLEYRLDGYEIRAGQPQSYGNGGQPQLTGPSAGKFVDVPGAQSLAGFRPADAGNHWRNNEDVYLDFETKVLPKWDIGVAGRFEHYSDFGSNVSGKFSTRYQFIPAFAMRATVSNGLRAPSVGQEYYSASATSQYQGVDYNIVTLAANSPAAKALGSQPLRPEESDNYSVGFVITPMPNMSFTVDGYRVDIRDRIVLSANIGLTPSGALNPGVSNVLEAQGIQGVNAGRYFLNGADTKTQGVDVTGAYKTDFDQYGSVRWSLAFNAGKTQITNVSAAANQTLFGTQVLNQVARDEITDGIPNTKLILGADYMVERWTVLVHETRYGSLTAPSTVAGGYSFEDAKWLTDLELGYAVTTAFHVAIGAQNLTNQYPSLTNPKNFNPATFNGAQIYNSDSPFGLSGGFYYGRASYSW